MKGFGVFVDNALSKGNQIVLIQPGFVEKKQLAARPGQNLFREVFSIHSKKLELVVWKLNIWFCSC
jgi:hypothetical protein